MTIRDTGRTLFARHRFAILFGLLFCVLLIPPYFENALWIGEFWRWLFTAMLLWSLYTVSGSRRVMVLALVVLIPTVASTWLVELEQQSYLTYIDNITNIVYFGLICVFMGQYILTTRRVTLEVIFAAMCLYMILAILWAAIYTNLELYFPGAFTFNGQVAEDAGIDKDSLYRTMIYYSFVTLSTLGYGDILPIHKVAQSWAAMEAMIGQFYIAVVIARLLSLYTVGEEDESLKEGSTS